jgi:putative FmdB family regulatory protein
MPVHSFVCPSCSNLAEVAYSVSDLQEPPVCELCGSVMKKLYAIGGVEFKGTGWGKD